MHEQRKHQRHGLTLVALVALVALGWPGTVSAQAADGTEQATAPAAPGLMSMDGQDLRRELQSRYQGALAQTVDPAVIGADSPRFLWALQAKAQCGIALGFLGSRTKDPVSIEKCESASLGWQGWPPASP